MPNLPVGAERIPHSTFRVRVHTALRHGLIDGWQALSLILEHMLLLDARRGDERRAA